MMTDGVGRRLATLRVQGLVRKSNGRRRRQRYQCRVVGSTPLSSIRKSLEAVVGYPVSKSHDSSRPTARLVCFAVTCLRRQRSQVRILSGAPIKSMSYDDLAQVVRKPSYHIATSVALIRGHFSLRPCCVLSVGRSPRAWHSTWRLRSGGFLDPKRRRRAAEFASGAACGGTGCDPAPNFDPVTINRLGGHEADRR
jgi:hypothetical protein